MQFNGNYYNYLGNKAYSLTYSRSARRFRYNWPQAERIVERQSSDFYRFLQHHWF